MLDFGDGFWLGVGATLGNLVIEVVVTALILGVLIAGVAAQSLRRERRSRNAGKGEQPK